MDFKPVNTSSFYPADQGKRRYLLSLDEDTVLIITDLLYRVAVEATTILNEDTYVPVRRAVFEMGERARQSLKDIEGQLYPEDN